MQNIIIWANENTLERIVNVDGTVVCTQRLRISDRERCEAVMTKLWRQLLKEQKQGKSGPKRRS
ncbi:hypothetical protein [Oryzomonas rubra]|uniref:Uncharacterized protein n=1 Tax=Oryzomonas rubra TaxID=2509454 RepID=A0A5A9X4R2_9BACT|nr:hypothetical protein [Oryzomonas rubra]KAA0887980.1 hypothetical protein ET418_17700 [Oryzomonas rubra]